MRVHLRRFCKGGDPDIQSSGTSSGGGFSRVSVNIPKMRVDGASQDGGVEVEIAGAGKGSQGKARGSSGQSQGAGKAKAFYLRPFGPKLCT